MVMLNDLRIKITRRNIQVALGILWLLDGALQLQPQMFTANFMDKVIAPAAQGQPEFVHGPIHLAIRIFLTHPAIFDALIALAQLSIGALILWKRTVKLGLAASIVWGLLVWYFGEALGGLASGQAMLLMGAPGAAALYSIISGGVWPAKSQERSPARWLAFVWAAIWLGGAVLQLNGGQNATYELSSMIGGMAAGAPGWLASLNLHVANFLQHTGNWLIAVLVIVQSVIGVLALAPRWFRTAAICFGVIVSLIFWLIGQGLGGFYTGLATDPNTAPLIILLGLAILNTEHFELGLT